MAYPLTVEHDLEPTADEQRIALTRDFHLIQKLRGHRYSVDDMLVGHLAVTFCALRSALQGGSAAPRAATRSGEPPPRRVLDLGCGLGSVLLICAWALPRTTLVGLELHPEHVAFAGRNIRLNGCEERVRVVAGDLRDPATIGSLGTFDLVTGSPPYFHPDSGTLCRDPARAAAHFELNGGIEDYAAAAARALEPGGRFVACAGADAERIRQALRQAGLSLTFWQLVVPRAGKPPFLTLLVATNRADVAPVEAPPLVLRDEAGRRTAEHRQIRAWTGVEAREP